MADRLSSMANIVRSPPAFPHQADRTIELLTSWRPSWTPRLTGFAPTVGRRRSTGQQAACYHGQVTVVRIGLHGAHQQVWVGTLVLMPLFVTAAGDSIAEERPASISSARPA
jgi:hypothetical protein